MSGTRSAFRKAQQFPQSSFRRITGIQTGISKDGGNKENEGRETRKEISALKEIPFRSIGKAARKPRGLIQEARKCGF
jgi:hypothetical protein